MADFLAKYRKILASLIVVATVVVAAVLGYVFGVEDSGTANDDAQVRTVIEQYVDAMNNGDLKKIKSLSIGEAKDELTPGFNAGARGVYPEKIIARIQKHGPIHIVRLNILARGEQVYIAELYTEFADQKTEVYFDPAAAVRFSMFRLQGKWKVMGIDKYVDYNGVGEE
ncbi:hypothetical protein [Mycobacteroides abscessus]|uniref:Rv0361 family membrane protein n=1 Tax=Mycobacteroides abscessus TaxID=36809 RepID=UPI001878596A|nr:hypothetical protein [Mycobacteroides abscessus]MBE5470030.1 hypothetical protein [Mycobacteroides abscessus]MDO3300910.1 hypothetical protein [Mycobacteroides abscessus subsp. massiliense]